MNDDLQPEIESHARRDSFDRSWLIAIALLSATLYLIGPLVSDLSSESRMATEQAASWADDIMEQGIKAARSDEIRQGAQGFLARVANIAVLLLNPTGDDERWSRAIACLLWSLS